LELVKCAVQSARAQLVESPAHLHHGHNLIEPEKMAAKKKRNAGKIIGEKFKKWDTEKWPSSKTMECFVG
jgi:hypothetical protein